ncbi:MAG: hypothetical protein JXR10_11005 [Cyclobacteriaceae bacterium]
MKFPSFIKVPKNSQFGIEPRYYDPVKEQIKERTEYIKRQMEGGNPDEYQSGRITFERKTNSVPQSSMLQMLIAAILGLLVVAWLYFGNQALYVLWLSVPVYLYFRFRGGRRK